MRSSGSPGRSQMKRTLSRFCTAQLRALPSASSGTRASRSTPNASPRATPSRVPSMATACMTWLTSLAAWAAPGSAPTRVTVPHGASSGSTRASARSGPAVTKTSVPASASPMLPRRIGASTSVPPAAATVPARPARWRGPTVEDTTTVRPGTARMPPPSPVPAPRTAASCGRSRTTTSTTSEASATSRGPATTSTPAAAARAAAASSGSQPTTAVPAATTLAAMRPPIVPRPTTPSTLTTRPPRTWSPPGRRCSPGVPAHDVELVGVAGDRQARRHEAPPERRHLVRDDPVGRQAQRAAVEAVEPGLVLPRRPVDRVAGLRGVGHVAVHDPGGVDLPEEAHGLVLLAGPDEVEHRRHGRAQVLGVRRGDELHGHDRRQRDGVLLDRHRDHDALVQPVPHLGEAAERGEAALGLDRHDVGAVVDQALEHVDRDRRRVQRLEAPQRDREEDHAEVGRVA